MESVTGKSVGLAGVGHMGIGIAKNVIKAGWKLSILDHAGNQPVGDLLEKGAKPVDTGEALAACSDIIILCLTGAPQVEEVLTRRGGIFDGIRPGSVIVDCSTSLPETTLAMAKRAAELGVSYVDAPMTRTPKEAMEGRLNLLAGGESADIERVRPLLESFAENIMLTGGLGTGHSMKLLHNYVSLGFSAILAEAAASANRLNVDARVFADVLEKGGGKSVVLDRFLPQILEGDPSGLKFSIANSQKDIGYYLEMVALAGSERVTAEGVFALFNEQIGAGHGQEYLPRLVEFLSVRKAS